MRNVLSLAGLPGWHCILRELVQSADARLRVDADCYPFTVVDLHLLLFAGRITAVLAAAACHGHSPTCAHPAAFVPLTSTNASPP